MRPEALARESLELRLQGLSLRLGQFHGRGDFGPRETKSFIQRRFQRPDDFGDENRAAVIHQHEEKIARDARQTERFSAIRPITAFLRLVGTAGVARASRRGRDSASVASRERNSASACAGERGEEGAVTTSARALAYRDATAENVILIPAAGR